MPTARRTPNGAVAMALGRPFQPLTRITPSVSGMSLPRPRDFFRNPAAHGKPQAEQSTVPHSGTPDRVPTRGYSDRDKSCLDQSVLSEPRTSTILCFTIALTACRIAAPRYSRGSTPAELSAKVGAQRRGRPEIFRVVDLADCHGCRTAELLLRKSDGVGHLPPSALISRTNSCGTEDAPCRTIGRPAAEISSQMSKRSGRDPRCGCTAPGVLIIGACRIPEMASESTPSRSRIPRPRQAGCRRSLRPCPWTSSSMPRLRLTLHHDAMRVGILHDLAGQRDVVLKGMLGAVDHNEEENPPSMHALQM